MNTVLINSKDDSANAPEAGREGVSRAPGSVSRVRGFTLIEIMIVVSILGLVLATGVPPMVRALKREGMTKAIADILQACKEARDTSVITQNKSQLTIRPMDHTIHAGKFSGQIPQNIAIISVGVNFVQYNQADEAIATFFPNGTSDEFSIVLQGENGEIRQIKLDIVTGCPVVMDHL